MKSFIENPAKKWPEPLPGHNPIYDMKNKFKKKISRALRKNRTRAKILGTADQPRLSVFRSNQYVWAQIINDEIGKTLISGATRGMKKSKKSEQAAELGKVLAEKAKKAGIKKIVFDRGFYKYHGRVKALAESFVQNLK